MSNPIYAGPGKLTWGGIGIQTVEEAGRITVAIPEPTVEFATAIHGRMGEQVMDQYAEITTAPFDNWSTLATLLPTRLGISVGTASDFSGGTAGVAKMGSRSHGPSNTGAKLWTWDGSLYTFIRAGLIQHPTLHLGAGKKLFGDIKLTCLGDCVTPVTLGGSSYFISGNAITEPTSVGGPGAADPDAGTFTLGDFTRGSWTGVWGNVPGFGGASSSVSSIGTHVIEAEEEWTIEIQTKYSPLKVQQRFLDYQLDSVNIMVRVRPYGPAHSDLLTSIGKHTSGMRLGTDTTSGVSGDLVLTGPNSKKIKIPNVSIKGPGFELGGTTLGTGEVGFVTGSAFTGIATSNTTDPWMFITA